MKVFTRVRRAIAGVAVFAISLATMMIVSGTGVNGEAHAAEGDVVMIAVYYKIPNGDRYPVSGVNRAVLGQAGVITELPESRTGHVPSIDSKITLSPPIGGVSGDQEIADHLFIQKSNGTYYLMYDFTDLTDITPVSTSVDINLTKMNYAFQPVDEKGNLIAEPFEQIGSIGDTVTVDHPIAGFTQLDKTFELKDSSDLINVVYHRQANVKLNVEYTTDSYGPDAQSTGGTSGISSVAEGANGSLKLTPPTSIFKQGQTPQDRPYVFSPDDQFTVVSGLDGFGVTYSNGELHYTNNAKEPGTVTVLVTLKKMAYTFQPVDESGKNIGGSFTQDATIGSTIAMNHVIDGYTLQTKSVKLADSNDVVKLVYSKSAAANTVAPATGSSTGAKPAKALASTGSNVIPVVVLAVISSMIGGAVISLRKKIVF